MCGRHLKKHSCVDSKTPPRVHSKRLRVCRQNAHTLPFSSLLHPLLGAYMCVAHAHKNTFSCTCTYTHTQKDVHVHVGVTSLAHFPWCLLFEAFDFPRGFMFFASRCCFKHFFRFQAAPLLQLKWCLNLKKCLKQLQEAKT